MADEIKEIEISVDVIVTANVNQITFAKMLIQWIESNGWVMGGSINTYSEANAKLTAAAPELLSELYEAELIIRVAKRDEAIRNGATYEEAERFAAEHHRIVSINKAIKKATE